MDLSGGSLNVFGDLLGESGGLLDVSSSVEFDLSNVDSKFDDQFLVVDLSGVFDSESNTSNSNGVSSNKDSGNSDGSDDVSNNDL